MTMLNIEGLALMGIAFVCALFMGFELGITESLTNDKQHLLTPTTLYENTKINKFGSLFVFILFLVLNPLGGLYRFGRFIFTVGKKNHEDPQDKTTKDDTSSKEIRENYKTAEEIRAIAEEIMTRDANCDLLYPEYNGVGWVDLCDKGIELFEKLKENEN